MSDGLYILSGTDERGNPAELIAPKGTLVSVVVCGDCRTPIMNGECPECSA